MLSFMNRSTGKFRELAGGHRPRDAASCVHMKPLGSPEPDPFVDKCLTPAPADKVKLLISLEW
jgi:hypothetical protein